MWLLKFSLNLKLSSLTFNLFVILKVTSQLEITLKEQLAFSFLNWVKPKIKFKDYIYIYIYMIFS
jgi:hypothetical protein